MTKQKAIQHMETHARVQNNLRWSHNFKLQRKDMEIPQGISKTVPDETYTIKELVTRFSKGMDPSISRLANWDEESEVTHDSPDFNEVARMDFVEGQQFLQQISDRREQITKQLEEQKMPLKVEDKTQENAPKAEALRHENANAKGAQS